ncbi:MAG: phenylalanine 4-monooxygenase [Planctomycetota bacterium]|nr:phenylalanine 4-monooxygenase [Planctomycetota bacterium]
MRQDIRYNNVIAGDEARIAQAAADAAPGQSASEIDADKFYITQRYELYTRADHDVWRDLFDRRWTVLEQQVSRQFIEGMRILRLTRDRLPLLDDLVLAQDIEIAGGVKVAGGTRLDGINKFLQAQSEWASYGVPGYLPAKAFFACLAQREFPTTVLIRPREVMDYLPEPDIFHDVFGHVPLHTLKVFADFLQTYGKAALLCDDPTHVTHLARLFWFTVEFGLIREDGQVKVYGSGLVSSHAESEYALKGQWERAGGAGTPDCTPREVPEWRPFDLRRICETDFEIDHFQPIYYVLDSFEQLRDAMNDYAEEVIGEAGLAAAGRR